EPIHGSAPDIANKDIANPFGMLLSVVMCLRESLNAPEAAHRLESIIYQLIEDEKTTQDLNGKYKTTDIFKFIKQNL
ncbi:isocitrate/isopropylmalate family dehydrogenase, partial [Bacillus amyloliquefaciens]